jgi:hypothetical protein
MNEKLLYIAEMANHSLNELKLCYVFQSREGSDVVTPYGTMIGSPCLQVQTTVFFQVTLQFTEKIYKKLRNNISLFFCKIVDNNPS